jgi:NAD(P)-dependent dehydrogenase (short-subunit alcohol dehydrogenase family)
MIEDTHTTLVTGGASGIGLATVEAFASHGGNVVVADGGYTAQ